METALGVIVGIGLSAACGFRVFLPLMGIAIAALTGYVTLSPGFQWIATWPALIAFTTATAIEIAAYYVPWVDNMIDSLMTPAAMVAGMFATASIITDMPPFLKWSFAIIAGGGISGIIQGGTAALRAGSSATTGGLANHIVSTIELVGAVLLTALAVLLPFLCLAVVAWICYKMVRILSKSVSIKKLFVSGVRGRKERGL
jgi:hypothetical protein